MLKIHRPPGYQDSRNYQQSGRNPKPVAHRIIVGDGHGVGDSSGLAVGFWLDPQKITARRNAGDNDGITARTFTPGTVRIVTGVIADLASKIVGLSGVIVYQRVIQVEPVVVQIRVAFHLYRGRPATSEFEWLGYKRMLSCGVIRIKSVSMSEDSF